MLFCMCGKNIASHKYRMEKMRALFIYPNLRGMNMLPPLVALFLRILKDRGFDVGLFDATYYKIDNDFDSDKEKEKNLSVRPFDMSKEVTLKTTDPFDDLQKLVNSFQPDLIAMSATEDIFPLGLRLLKHIDKYNILTVVGGVFPTFAPEKVIRNKEIDIVCVGEGEDALLELCNKLRKGNIEADTPTSFLTGEPVLDMPQFPKEKIKGIRKTFSLYVKFDRSRWNDIRIAEKCTLEGNEMFRKLREEYTRYIFR